MPVRVFGTDGKEFHLSTIKPPRSLNPFELGFHKSVLGSPNDENPFPVHSDQANEWDAGWKVYKDRKTKMKWYDPKINSPGGEDTYLCLVKDRDGYFLHKPCKPKISGWSITLVWIDFKGGVGIQVEEYAIVPMKKPQFVNAMQSAPNWKATNPE